MQEIFSPLIEVKDLSFSYSSRKDFVLENLNFKIYPGDMIGLIGENGSGKTTLFKILSGLLKGYEGEILLEGKNLTDYRGKELSFFSSIVLTESPHPSNMTVFEFVAQGRFPYTGLLGLLSIKDREKVFEILSLLDISPLEKMIFLELSDGQKQKVQIARALSQETKVIFLDEPTNFLDMFHKTQVLRALKLLVREKKIAVVFSTHDFSSLLEMASWLWAFSKDKKLLLGTPEDFILNGTLEEMFKSRDFILEKSSGKFKELRDFTFSASVRGDDDLLVKWIKHALEKVFIEIKEETNRDVDFDIRVKNSSIEIYQSERLIHMCKDIQALLNILKVF